jgi:glycosyltransferase involved in cell wall biosynthesis
LPWLSRQAPVILTLHDAWLLSGHCAHSFECERWRTGCGNCPDLAVYPTVNRDATSYNWRRKRDIYSKCKLYVATPCEWLMQKVRSSMLGSAVAEARIIPYGIDLSVFRPADKKAVRESFGMPQNSKVLLFAANGVRKNPFKDYLTMRDAVSFVAERNREKDIIFIALGDGESSEKIGQAEIRFVRYQKDPKVVAAYLQLADLYIHSARADTFPNVILEALACGTPVVATAVGGIPEQVKGMRIDDQGMPPLNCYGVDEATGILISEADAKGMAAGIERLLDDPDLRSRLSDNASKDAALRFDLQRQVNDYLEWYETILKRQC